jgi:acyl-CoA synthetase (AMP-forming)/AMP-acid ligase II
MEKEPDASAILTHNRPATDDITQLIYTSGTTGEHKGVMHSANTLMANIVPYAKRLPRNDSLAVRLQLAGQRNSAQQHANQACAEHWPREVPSLCQRTRSGSSPAPTN